MDTQHLPEQALAKYEQIDSISRDIESAVSNNAMATLPQLCAQLDQAQDEAKILDACMLELLRNDEIRREDPQTQAWFGLICAIHSRNQQLLPRLNALLALQRNELRTLHKGAAVLHGYKPVMPTTGRRLSSAG